MKKKKICFFLLTLLIIVSCNNSSKEKDGSISSKNRETISVTPQIKNQILLSDIAKSINIFELKAKDSDGIIGNIKKIDTDNDLYFCMDGINSSIYCYNMQGDFITNIGRKGRGPGEYLYPVTFGLDKDNDEIWVIDNGKEIKKYSYSGTFIESVKIESMSLSDFIIDNNSLICYTAKATNWKNDGTDDYWCNELTIINQDSIKHRYIPVNKELYPIENRLTIKSTTPFSVLNNSITFHHTVGDTIYSINKKSGKIESKYLIEFGTEAFKDDLSKMKTEDMIKYMNDNSDKAGFTNNVVETESFLHFRYIFQQRVNRVIYDKKRGKLKDGLDVNDLFTAPYVVIGSYGNTLIACIDNPKSIEFTDKASSFFSPDVISKFSKLDTESNAIIVEIELKSID